MIHYITSRNNTRIKELLKLKDSKVRKEKELFFVEGYHLLEMALANKQVEMIISEKVIEGVDESIDQIIVAHEIVQRFSSQITSQGVIAICKMKKDVTIEGDHLLYLDEVSDPGNVGTILRIAAAFGFKSVILSPNCCSPFNDKAINASQGAIFVVNTIEGDLSTLEKLKKDGYQIIVSDVHDGVSLSKAKINRKCVVVLGNEARGVGLKTKSLASLKVMIPMKNIESLNVAVAGGIICYQIAANEE